MTTAFAGDAGANAAVVQDGKVVAAGSAMVGSTVDFALARYRRDGSLDRTFGTGGRVTTDFGGGGAQATALGVQADGKLVAAGIAGPCCAFGLARYRANGRLDAGFGTGGKVTTDFGSDDVGHALVVQADGNLVAAGVVESRFEPAAEPNLELCGTCPGRAALCSWDEQHTLLGPHVHGQGHVHVREDDDVVKWDKQQLTQASSPFCLSYITNSSFN